jgi:hypothetical protein
MTMRNNMYKYFLVIALVAGSVSCKKWLDLKPADGIVADEFWKTKEQLASAVTGMYASLIGNPQGINDRQLSEYLFMWGELRADMVIPSTGATNDDFDTYNVNLLSTNNNVNWRAVYRTINYCNTVITLGPGVLKTDNTLTQTQLNNYLSEAYALRGLMYFYLVRTFGAVPLKLTATTSDENVEQLAKTSADSVLTQIVADLTKAEPMAVTSYASTAATRGKITRYTINAILADVYLWMEKYNDCIAACDKVITSGKYGLITHNAFFAAIFREGNSNESIFEFQFDKQALNPFYSLFLTSRRRYEASATVMENMYTIDYTSEDSVDFRGTGASVLTSNNTLWKYVSLDYNTALTQDASYKHWIVYRYADVLMMKAEAMTQIGRGNEALEIVYKIRSRGHALMATDMNAGADDKAALNDYIMAERGI